jgi:hypothetical protein
MNAIYPIETSVIFNRLYKVTFQKLGRHMKVLEYVQIHIYHGPIFHMKSAFGGKHYCFIAFEVLNNGSVVRDIAPFSPLKVN